MLSKLYYCLWVVLLLGHSADATIIFLNGTSSAGKSSILKELVKRLGPDYVPVSVDKFKLALFRQAASDLQLLPETAKLKSIADLMQHTDQLPYPESKRHDTYFRQLGRTMMPRMYSHIADLATAGQHVIVDHVLTHDHDIQQCLRMLKGFDVFFVLVHCPFDELVDRLAKRNSFGKKRENRSMGAVFAYYSYIYKPSKKKNCVEQLTREQIHESLDRARPLFSSDNSFDRCCRLLLHRFDLNHETALYLKPALAYDYIINSAQATPAACADRIVKKLLKKQESFTAFSKNRKKMLKSR